MIMAYQLLHGGVNLDPHLFFAPAASGPTRGHTWKLMKPRAETRTKKLTFGVRVVNDWNTFPASADLAHTLNAFKARLDAHWPHLHHSHQ